MKFKLRILLLLGGMVMFVPMLSIPDFFKNTVLFVIGFMIIIQAFAANKQYYTILEKIKRLKDGE